MKQKTEYNITTYNLIMPAILQGIAWPFGRLCVNFFVHLKVRGYKNLKKADEISKDKGIGTIFAVNHTNELDFLFILVGIPPQSPLFPMFYVAKSRKSYATDTAFGLKRFIYGAPAFLTSWGAHPFVKGQKDYTKSMPYHEALLRKGKSVCIFPEGKIQKNGVGKIVHGGVAYLAESTRATIVPVHINGAEFMGMQNFFLRKREVTVSYGEPINIKDILIKTKSIPDRYKIASSKLMDILYKL